MYVNSTNIPIPELWVRDIETIKVIADPLRLKLVELMAEPTTVKAMADDMGIPASKLYYHVNLLQKHRLIQVVDHNLESGIVEKVYRVTARQFKLVNPLIADSEFPEEAADALFNNMLQSATKGFQRAFALRDKREPVPPRQPFLSQKGIRLSDAQLSAFHTRLDALIKEVTVLAEENESSDEPHYELTVVFYKTEPMHVSSRTS